MIAAVLAAHLAAAPIRDYTTWVRYAACINGPNGIGRAGHSERWCRRWIAK